MPPYFLYLIIHSSKKRNVVWFNFFTFKVKSKNVKSLNIPLLIILFFISCSKKQPKEEKGLNNPFYDLAFNLREKGKMDSAFLYFNQAKDSFLQSKDSLGVAKCFVNMAIISTDKGDNFGGEELSLNALAYFNKNNPKHFIFLRSNYNNLGLAAQNLKDYLKSIEFYEQAITYATDSNDVLVIKNNISNAYRENKDYKRSIALYEDILKNNISSNHYARVLSNLAFAKWLENRAYNAAPILTKALNIRLKDNDAIGQNASYAQLTDYYSEKQPQLAQSYAVSRLKVAKRNKMPDDQLVALQNLIKLSSLKESRQYFSLYQNLDDSLRTARNAAKNQFALIRYETEKHKADFLNAQAENIQKQNNILIQNFALAILASVLVLGYFAYLKRKKRLQQEKELEVKNTELKYVKKIHDRVANRVYQVMSEVENTPTIDKNALADKLEVIYKISRDLSYESNEINIEANFAEELSKMLDSYLSDKIKFQITGNYAQLWEKVNSTAKSEVFYILQELMTNMGKHSSATIVSLQFKRQDGHIEILYSDNGKGIKGALAQNGLRNTETRIESISGIITFDTKPDNGLEIQLSFPIL
jgi:tetratricopeptide (TPR) repeat protein